MIDILEYDDILHLITPGIDSACGYYYLKSILKPKHNLKLAYVPISPRYKNIEIDALKYFYKYFKATSINILDVDFQNVKEYKDGFIPSRNLLIATALDASTLIDHKVKTLISFGFTSDDRVYDSNEIFCKDVSKVLSDNVYMGSLLRSMSKSELLKWFVNEEPTLTDDGKYDIISHTYSCYSGNQTECLSCNACFRKSVVLYSAYKQIRDVLNKDFLKRRLSILKDKNVSQERKDLIISYVRALEKLNKEKYLDC